MLVSKALAQRAIRALVPLVLAATPAVAAPINFTCLTNNSSGQCAGVASQIQVNATDPGSDRLQLVFSNSGPLASSITDIYFDFAGTLFSGFFSSTGNPAAGVDFPFTPGDLTNAAPANLPSGNTAATPFVADMSIDSPTAPNGIGPGESLTLLLNINASTYGIGDVVSQFQSGALRIGLHVQSIGTNGDSESLISTPHPNLFSDDPAVPEPSTWLLMSAGVVGLIVRRRFIG